MAEFAYIARNELGAEINGELTAATKREALAMIAGRSLTPIRVMPVDRPIARKRCRMPARFYTEIADLLKAGVPLMKTLEVLRQQTTNTEQNQVLTHLVERLADGAALSEAMQERTDVFNAITIGIVHAGEEGGFLEDSLRQLAEFHQRSDELRSRLIQATIYPLFLLSASGALIIGLLVFFVPTFAPIFERLAAQGSLPWATECLILASQTLRQHGWLLAMSIGLLAFVAGSTLKLETIRNWLLETLSHGRVLGKLINETATSRFCRVLGTLLANGVPLVRSLRITRHTVGIASFSTTLDRAASRISDGESLASQLSQCHCIPFDIAAMIGVAEQANSLEQTLVDAADILEKRASRRLEVLLKLLEPLLLLVLAGVVLFLVVGLMLPIFDAAGTMN